MLTGTGYLFLIVVEISMVIEISAQQKTRNPHLLFDAFPSANFKFGAHFAGGVCAP
jgi:hypothetical protein